MKKLLLVVVCASAFVSVKAQVQFGAKAGLNLSNIVGSDADGAKIKAGFNGGGFARFGLTENIKVQPELLYSGQGAKFEENFDGQTFTFTHNSSYLNIPVLVQYHTPVGFYGETGPQIGFLLSAKIKGDGETEDVKDQYKGTDFSWAFGAGYQFEQGFGINARYNLGLSKLDKDGDANVKNSVIQIGVFYVFGGSAE